MSFNIRSSREISNDPLTKFVSHLAKKISDFATKDQTEDLENKEDIYSSGQDVESVLRFHSFISNKKFDFSLPYYPPTEPDFDKLRLWIRGINTGNSLDDFAMRYLYNDIIIHGDPLLVDGLPHDDGINTGDTKSIALKFNRPNHSTEFIEVDQPTTLARVSEGLSTGISFFMRFRVFDISQQGGSDRTLFEKTDNDPITDGIRVNISDTGRLKVTFKNDNVVYAWQTATSTIAVDIVYDIWITYAESGNVIHIYVNGVDKSLTSHAGNDFHSDTTNKDYYIFRRGEGSNEGYVYGDFYDFRVYREKIVSATEVGYMQTNKWTISNVPFGQVMVNNYWSEYQDPQFGYTTTGYTTTGYTAG